MDTRSELQRERDTARVRMQALFALAKMEGQGFGDAEHAEFLALGKRIDRATAALDAVSAKRDAEKPRPTVRPVRTETPAVRRDAVLHGPALARALERDPGEARATAYHEAGHSVAAYLEGTGVRRVWLRWDAHGRLAGGSCEYRHHSISPATFAAGRAAEELAGFDTPESSSVGDRATAAARAAERGQPGWWHEAREHENARGLLTRHWPAVTAVARALLERGELDGAEVERLIEANLDQATRQRVPA